MKLIRYELHKPFINKSWGIWGVFEPNILMPIIYLKKPSRISEDEWQEIMENIKISFPKDFQPGRVNDEEN
jgi:hypothetical protein